MRSKSRHHRSADILGLRHHPGHGDAGHDLPSGRPRKRRHRRLATVLATATLAFPHFARHQTPKRPRRDPVAVVTTNVETAIAVPPQHAYDSLIHEAAERYGVDAVLIKSVMQAESAFNALAVSRAGALGLMQLMPQLADELAIEDPFDARQNIMGGAQDLRQLLDHYRGNVRLALAGYNAGIARVRHHGGVPPFRETQQYVKRVTALVEQSRREETE